MKKIIIALFLVVVIALAGVLATSYFMLDKIIHRGIEFIGPEAAGVSVKVNSVNISPLSGTFGLNMLALGNPEGFSADRSFIVRDFSVKVDMSSLLKDVIIVEEVVIDGASVTWEGFTGDNHRQIMRNIDNYAAGFKKPDEGKAGAPKAEESGKKIIIKNVYLKNSSMDFVAAGRKLVTIPVPALHLTDIGAKEGGESPGEAIQQTYEQIYAALARSANANARLFREKLGELGEIGSELLEKAGESTRGFLDKAGSRLDDLRKNIGELFKK
ncbi:MAG: hypothetical protein PHU03_05460 [Syntrophales bacterium]|nr:hypothetical protein [Syntrophales bacterium]